LIMTRKWRDGVNQFFTRKLFDKTNNSHIIKHRQIVTGEQYE
jgi:hypothetical protein